MDKKTHTYKFKAEVKQLLDILAHSLYTNREIFLRELISNASDALEKLRFETLKGTKVADDKLPLEISIDFDKDKNILTLTDSGIGMTDDEFILWRKNPGSFLDKLDFPRQALHCSRVSFLHPHKNMECQIKAPLPPDISTFMHNSSD